MAGAAAGAAFRNELNIDVDGVSVDTLTADLSTLSDREVEALVLTAEREQSRVDAVRSSLMAELDRRGSTDRDHGSRTPNWVAHALRLPIVDVRRRVRVSVRLAEEFPELAAALAAGLVSWAHADEFCHASPPRIAELMRWLLPELIASAGEVSFDVWRRDLRRAAKSLDPDPPSSNGAEDDERRSRCSLSRNPDGGYTVYGKMYGALGAAIAQGLEVETDRQFRLHNELQEQTNGETPVPSRTQLRALALGEIVRRFQVVDTQRSKRPATDLSVVLHLGNTDPDDPTSGDHTHDEYETPDGNILTRDQMGCRLCDPLLHLMRQRDLVMLDLGRTQRYANRDQRRAAGARDGGCVFPGCDAPHRWCDLHHHPDWEKGGHTDIGHLASLCRFHHGVTHRRGWTMFINSDGSFGWTTPLGQELRSDHRQHRSHSTP